jgi:hypothetical protein
MPSMSRVCLNMVTWVRASRRWDVDGRFSRKFPNSEFDRTRNCHILTHHHVEKMTPATSKEEGLMLGICAAKRPLWLRHEVKKGLGPDLRAASPGPGSISHHCQPCSDCDHIRILFLWRGVKKQHPILISSHFMTHITVVLTSDLTFVIFLRPTYIASGDLSEGECLRLCVISFVFAVVAVTNHIVIHLIFDPQLS